MKLSKRERTIKYSVYALVILAAAIIQNVLSVKLEIAGARCFIVLPCAVMLGIDEDERIAALYGLFAGFLWDMVSAQHMGFNCIYIMFMCYFTAALVVFAFRNTFLFSFITSALVTVIYCVLYWLFFVLIGSKQGGGAALLFFYLPSALYTIAVSPFVYLVLKPLKNKLNKREKIIAN